MQWPIKEVERLRHSKLTVDDVKLEAGTVVRLMDVAGVQVLLTPQALNLKLFKGKVWNQVEQFHLQLIMIRELKTYDKLVDAYANYEQEQLVARTFFCLDYYSLESFV